MKADFSGYATKNGLKCSDGRTIVADAFAHQDGSTIPLVWQHQHGDPVNILGHGILENRADGVYVYGFFNDTDQGQVAKQLVAHKDIDKLSIYANNLTQKTKNVVHGDIKEVSLVLSGANPGAVIDNLAIAHGDGSYEDVEDEAIIYTDDDTIIQHEDLEGEIVAPTPKNQVEDEEIVEHADASTKTIQDVFDELTDDQKNVVYYMIGQALDGAGDGSDTATHSDIDTGEFLQHVSSDIQEGFDNMARNIFEQNGKTAGTAEHPTLSHSDLEIIVKDAQKNGSLKEAFISHADSLGYGIDDIDFLFPDAKTLSNSPEILSRRTEWVANVISTTKHSPFSRIKSIVADITADEARAKGYVKGNLKKDEIIKLLKRVTTPSTVYKKQKLDRDDIVDITDVDVVAWLKAEMRVMLDEEVARAILIGDGREPDDEDKIDEDHLRPIAYDDDMYAHSVTLASNTGAEDLEEAILRSRTYYKGTGTPTFYTTDGVLTDMFLRKDKMGRRIYDSVEQLAAALRVQSIVVVEVMEDNADILGIIVNLVDYTVGADRGGEISMFDDFDIDYNQYKYLIETRISGALTKPKAAVVIKKSAGTTVSPVQPTYNPTTHVITIPTTTGVIYSVEGVDKTNGSTVTITETSEVESRPAANYSFPHNIDTDWVFTF